MHYYAYDSQSINVEQLSLQRTPSGAISLTNRLVLLVLKMCILTVLLGINM